MSASIGDTNVYEGLYESRFSMSDFIADVDAVNMYGYDEDMTIYEVFADYYDGAYSHEGNDQYYIFNKTFAYTQSKYLGIVTWPLLEEVDVTLDQSYGATRAYTDFLWKLVQKEKNGN